MKMKLGCKLAEFNQNCSLSLSQNCSLSLSQNLFFSNFSLRIKSSIYLCEGELKSYQAINIQAFSEPSLENE